MKNDANIWNLPINTPNPSVMRSFVILSNVLNFNYGNFPKYSAENFLISEKKQLQ